MRAIFLAMMLPPTSVFGQTLDEIVANRPLSLVGTSTLKVMLFNVFDSALYTESGEWDEPDHSFRLTLTYKRSLKARWLVRSTGEEWAHLGIQMVEPSTGKTSSPTYGPTSAKATVSPSMSMPRVLVISSTIKIKSGPLLTPILDRCLRQFGCHRTPLNPSIENAFWVRGESL